MKAGKKKILLINEEYCKECGFCIKFCPNNTLAKKNTINSRGFHPAELKGECSFCGICYTVCPDFAIEIVDEEQISR
ncbi:MAG: 4Fe-4S binding protein [Elusimicrobia bacterium]|nr:4Fe-4S binding protein [Elusimicrobiota bacterium]